MATMKKNKYLFLGLLSSIMFLQGCGGTTQGDDHAEHSHKEQSVSVPHVHGLAYTPDGNEVFMPAHDGILVYKEGKWNKSPNPAHDYMGFVMADNAFYSSGHPAPNSGLQDPLGLVKSNDGGKTLEKLALYGVSDFHIMSVGYHNHVLLVYNDHPNEKLGQGVFISKDDGKTWSKLSMNGVSGAPTVVAVHPTDEKVLVFGTKQGLYITKDGGNTFSLQSASTIEIVGLQYSSDGTQLWVSGWNGKEPVLYSIENDEKKERKLPITGQDAVLYIAVHPKNKDELMIATHTKSIFLSKDQGNNWTQLIDKGTVTGK